MVRLVCWPGYVCELLSLMGRAQLELLISSVVDAKNASSPPREIDSKECCWSEGKRVSLPRSVVK